VAHSFAPQFFRHAIVHGLPVAECPGILDLVGPGDVLTMDFATGEGRNDTTGRPVSATVPGGIAADIVGRGGLLPFLRNELSTSR
jgi:3-isopropylmalate/(R)-2-methylmalate dehydratase small subunit